REVLVMETPPRAGDLLGRDVDGALAGEGGGRHRRLRQNRRHDRRLGHHRQREAAGEAHADRAHAPAAAFAMRLARQRAQPVDDGARSAAGPDIELAADADGLDHRGHRVAACHRTAGLAEQARAEHRHAGGRDAVGEADHQRVQPGDFMDDDDGGALAAAVDFARPASVVELERGVVLQSGRIVHCPSFPMPLPFREIRGHEMTWASLSAFAVAMTALCVVPGPAVLLVVSQALSHGSAKAVWSILGVTAAGTAWFVLSATGLGAVLRASYELFFAIKWVGVVYLLWLGISAFRRTSKLASVKPDPGSGRPMRLFANGFVLQMANPNVLLFFTAFLPQFIAPKAPLVPQLAVLAVVTAIIELVVQLAYAFLAGRFRELLAAPRFTKLTERIAGSLLIAAGLGMAALRRG